MRNRGLWTAFLIVGVVLAGCTAAETAATEMPPLTPIPLPVDSSPEATCPVTKPVWAKPAEDSAVQNPPAYGYYYINDDSSIWASAWWAEAGTGGSEEYTLRVSEEGIKVGWFRPAGATLEITGQRLDGEAPPLEAEASCCYPTRFQASGLYFPTEGCWEVTAKAPDNVLTFVVWVEP